MGPLVRKFVSFFFISCGLCTLVAVKVEASERTRVEVGSDMIVWQPPEDAMGSTLVVSGPSGLSRRNFGAEEAPHFSVFRGDGSARADGEYTWELRSKRRSADVESSEAEVLESSVEWGYFFVHDGIFVLAGEEVTGEESRKPVQREFVGEDDLVLIGRLCVGLACASGEMFDDHTFRMKGEDIKQAFVDTSASASSNDWQLTVNGAAKKFSLEDLDGGTTPFTMEAGSPDNSLYVDDVGRVGFRTATPSAGLHVVGNVTNNPDIYLESTDGLNPLTWRIRNTPNTGRLTYNVVGGGVPFKFASGTQNNLLRIGIADVGGFGLDQPNTVSLGSSNVGENATSLEVWGSIKLNGATIHADYVFQPEYELPSIEQHAEFMWSNSHLPGLPKAPEGLVGTVDLGEHQMGILKELEIAHIYIDQLNDVVKAQEKTLEAQSSLLRDLQQRLHALEGSQN